MSDLAILNAAAGLDGGNVAIILGVLEGIHDRVADDEVMADFADTVLLAIQQLRTLRRLAYDTMMEIESERVFDRGRSSSRRKKPH